jgi:hypothetical protein
MSQAGSGSGGTPSNAGTSSGKGGAASGAAGSSSGTPNAGGSANGGSGGTTAGTSGTGGAAGTAGSTGGGGASGTAGNGGTSGSTSAGDGGSAQAGSGGGTGGGSGSGGSGGDSTACTREGLTSIRDAYFVALAANDPSTLPLAASAKFTENGEEMTIGEGGLWATAGELKYVHSAIDTEACTILSEAVVPDGNTDLTFALRLKLEAGELTEIETIAVRSGDYILAPNPGDLSGSDDTIHWEEAIPEADRATHDELTAWMDKYFRMFPQGVCNTTSDCLRIENGAGSFVCSSGAGCASGDPGPSDNELTPRLLFADPERGIGVGFTMFQNQYTDMHMFKRNAAGQVTCVSAILASADGPGWE